MSLLVTYCLLAAVFCWCLHRRQRSIRGATETVPEAGGKWPLIGHLHLFRGSKLPHITFADLSEKYGPIFTIRLGVRRVVMVSSWEIAQECFTVHDVAISSRPRTVATDLMSYNYAMFGFGPYSSYCRELRKISSLELLSNRQLHALQPVRVTEVQDMIKELYRLWSKTGKRPILVDVKERFTDLTLNVTLRMVVGKRYPNSGDEEAVRWKKAIHSFFRFTGQFTLGDALPSLRWLDVGGFEMKMKEVAAELDFILEGWLQEHVGKRSSGETTGSDDFMSVLLSVLDVNKLGVFDVGTVAKATCLAMLTGGSDTTMVVLTWALSLLMNNPSALKKAQDELDRHVGRNRQLDESDISKLEYIQAITKETLRLYPPGTLGGQRVFTEDCTVAGYRVHRGTMLLLNLWKIQRDPRVWEEPSEFRPERFLTTHKGVDVRGKDFRLIPFGGGRRGCPGISFGLVMLNFVLACMLHAFDFSTPSGEAVDMGESFGLTNVKKAPLQLLLSPRLPSHLY